jgi:hypothetical protein
MVVLDTEFNSLSNGDTSKVGHRTKMGVLPEIPGF